MNMTARIVVAATSVIILLQLFRPAIPSAPAVDDMQAPPHVQHLFDEHCYSCHSSQRRLSWFDEVQPAYLLVRHDILTAREHLNFSTLGAKAAAAQKGMLYEAVNMIQLGAMPPPSFLLLHSDAKVTPAELCVLKAYLDPWSEAPKHAGIVTDVAAPVNMAAVPPESNGLEFQKDFESWKPISFTDRGDNNTFRIILANKIAVEAVRSGEISPWPDGTRFAKIAWQQQVMPDGLITPGKFVQVEFMIKNASLYKQTSGWGWGRWRGPNLKPYGRNACFVDECTGCHLPLRGADNVYTLPLSITHINGQEVVNNRAANLPAGLPYQPLSWRAITMYVDPASHSMATLFGNDAAMQAAHAGGNPLRYSPGSVLALVRWAQRDDPHWFGARIPDRPLSVEFVVIGPQARPGTYRCYEGRSATAASVSTEKAAQRTQFILSLAPARLP